MRAGSQGFTLVELLVALGILGVLMVALTNWQVSTIGQARQATGLAGRLRGLGDVMGYVGDRVRAGQAVRVDNGALGFTVNGLDCAAQTPCLAVLASQDNAVSTGFQREYLYVVYRLEPRSTWTSADKVADAWADTAANGVNILQEYRFSCLATTANANCASFQAAFAAAPAFTNMTASVVADGLASTQASGTPVPGWTYTYTPGTKSGVVTLPFLMVGRVDGQVSYTPTTGPLTLTIQARNVQ